METFVQADIVPFTENIWLAVKPIAESKNIGLTFIAKEKKVSAFFNPAALASELIEKTCSLVQVASAKQQVILSIERINKDACEITVKIKAANTASRTMVDAG
jgi:hypothetical protein